MSTQFFYSGQIRRFLVQFIRVMSHFSVEFGVDSNGVRALQTVPVFYGDGSRQGASIITGNSENATPTVPAMSCYISGFDYDRARVQDPTFVGKLSMAERSYNSTTNTWGTNQGNAFSIERPMPVPYKLTIKLDIWTSNKEQKMQLIEQICPLFNPDIELQSTDNYIDWTSLTAIILTGTNWSSRTIPVGAEDSIDVSTLTFELPIWLSLPAKVKKLGVVQRMISSLYDADGNLEATIADLPTNQILAQRALTPLNYGVVYQGNTLRLIRETSIVTETNDGVFVEPGVHTDSWKNLIDSYGLNLLNGTSEIQLEQPNGSVLVGTISYHPTDSTLLLFSPFLDTVPSNTLPAVNAIIDPYAMQVDSTFLNVAIGTRYLILNDIGSLTNTEPAQAWGNLVAKANDIIEFNGTHWIVSFSAASVHEVKYFTNLKSGLQFKWVPEQRSWFKSIEGKYEAETWTIILSTLQ